MFISFALVNIRGLGGHQGTSVLFLMIKDCGGLIGHKGTNYFQVLLFFQILHNCGGHSEHK